jgi:outer membrane protein assembly factor BamE (lipoprotein component of BamABCDE complex)
MRYWLQVVVALVLLGGCATEDQSLERGNPNLTEPKVEAVQVGMQEKDVIAVMGKPDEVVGLEDGMEEWVYRGSQAEWLRPSAFSKKTTTVRAKVLSVLMNSDGMVTHVSYDELQEKTTQPF